MPLTRRVRCTPELLEHIRCPRSCRRSGFPLKGEGSGPLRHFLPCPLFRSGQLDRADATGLAPCAEFLGAGSQVALRRCGLLRRCLKARWPKRKAVSASWGCVSDRPPCACRQWRPVADRAIERKEVRTMPTYRITKVFFVQQVNSWSRNS